MKIRNLTAGSAMLLAGCAVSGTQVLAPYRLADGTKLQDVVTIGADKTGTAPVVTQVKTFKIGGKGGATLVSDGAGSGLGMGAVVVGSVVSGVTGGVTGGLIANAVRTHHHSSPASSSDADMCSNPANAQSQACLCTANPRLQGCDG